jgi:two-component system NtrC family sensor kinase
LKEDHKLIVKGERVAAILETAVAINHEINNPLTAVLGNTQLLLLQKDKLPDDVITKINTIEKSALRIRQVTQKLMTIVEPITTNYTANLDMLDIEKSSSKE